MISCSIVVPVHNEGKNLEELFMRFWNNLGRLKKNIAEIHLMENGSNDDTFQICKKLERVTSNGVIAHKIQIPSYGKAVKQGIMASSGDVVCILECDVMDIAFISSSLAILEQNKAEFVVASKRHPDSVDLRPFKRRMLTFLFNLGLKLYFNFPISDTHGLKAIRTNVAKSLCELSITGGEIFQTEILLLAYKMGYRILEMPIRIEEQRDTKVSLYRRLPKVINIINDLKRSLARFSE